MSTRIETRHVIDDTIDMDSLTTSLNQHLQDIANRGGRIISVLPHSSNRINEHQHFTLVIEWPQPPVSAPNKQNSD